MISLTPMFAGSSSLWWAEGRCFTPHWDPPLTMKLLQTRSCLGKEACSEAFDRPLTSPVYGGVAPQWPTVGRAGDDLITAALRRWREEIKRNIVGTLSSVMFDVETHDGLDLSDSSSNLDQVKQMKQGEALV